MNITNPYSNHPQLSPLEQDVLWEYAKLGQHIRRLSELCRTTATTPNEALLLELRELEKKMGLVLTLFKGAVWAVFMDSKTQDTNISDTGTL